MEPKFNIASDGHRIIETDIKISEIANLKKIILESMHARIRCPVFASSLSLL